MKRAVEERPKLNTAVCMMLIIFAIAVFGAFSAYVRMGVYPDRRVRVEGPCDVTINGVVYEDVYLRDFTFDPAKKGDRIAYSFTYEDKGIDSPALTIYLDHSAVRVLVDGKTVFEEGSPDSLMLGYGYQTVDLPSDGAAHRITVEMYIIENEGMTTLPRPVISDRTVMEHNYIAEHCLYLLIVLSIIVISLLIMLIGGFFSWSVPELSRLVYLGLAFMLLGIWEMCSYDLLRVFSDSLVLRGYLEYPALYIGPFFLSIYLYYEFFEPETDRMKTAYMILMHIEGVFPIVVFVLHFADIVHLPAVLPVYHIIQLVNIFMILYMLARQIKRRDNSHLSLALGLAAIMIMALIDLLRFNINKYIRTEEMEGYTSALLIGFFLFFVAMIVDFIASQRRNAVKVARAEAMDRLAHIDIMTELANRRRCEEIFAGLADGSRVYGIISIDINFLKKANDNYGHQEGDRLLTDFAALLKEVCRDRDAVAGRMGGDEFIIIINDADALDANEIIADLDGRLKEVNASRTPFPISYSWGYCRSDDDTAGTDESEGIVESVYQTADERMYAQKTAMHARREDN